MALSSLQSDLIPTHTWAIPKMEIQPEFHAHYPFYLLVSFAVLLTHLVQFIQRLNLGHHVKITLGSLFLVILSDTLREI